MTRPVQFDLFGEVETEIVVDQRAAAAPPRKPKSSPPRRRQTPKPSGMALFPCVRCQTEPVNDPHDSCGTCASIIAAEDEAREQAWFRWVVTTALEEGHSVIDHVTSENRGWWEESDAYTDDELAQVIVDRHDDDTCRVGGCWRFTTERRSWLPEPWERRRDWGWAQPMPRWIGLSHWIEDWTCDHWLELWGENGVEPWYQPVPVRPYVDVDLGPTGVSALGEFVEWPEAA